MDGTAQRQNASWDNYEWRIAAVQCITHVHFIHGEINRALTLHPQTSDYKCATTHPPLYSPRVKLVNDALEANNCEKSRTEPSQPGQKENGERQQRLPSRRLRQSPGQASAAASSRGVGPSVARDRTSGVGARFVLTVGGSVVLRHVLEDLVRKALPTATHPSFRQPAPSSAPIFLRNQAFAPTAGIWRCVLIIWIYLQQIPRLSGMLTGTRDPLDGGGGGGGWTGRFCSIHSRKNLSASHSETGRTRRVTRATLSANPLQANHWQEPMRSRTAWNVDKHKRKNVDRRLANPVPGFQ